MKITALFAQCDYACRCNTHGGIRSLTAEFIQTVCVTCPARVHYRACCRNIITVERKLSQLLDTPPTTRKCARENCDRHILITPQNQDVVTLVCEWCRAREAAQRQRTICAVPGCYHQGFRARLCQFHFQQHRAALRNRVLTKLNPSASPHGDASKEQLQWLT